MSSPLATLRLGSDELELRPNAPQRLEVAEGTSMSLFAAGLQAHLPTTLTLGDRREELWPEPEGSLRWQTRDALRSVAGQVRFELCQEGLAPLVATLGVRPTRLTQAALEILLADLHRMAPGIAGALGGLSSAPGLHGPEASLQRLEAQLGAVISAASWISRNPIVNTKELAYAIPSREGPASAADARWIARNPRHAIRPRLRSGRVAVRREVRRNADTPENRGVMALLRAMKVLAEELQALLERERARINQSRPAREAFATQHGNLFQEIDAPRLSAIQRRTIRLEELKRQLSALPTKMRLPRGLRASTFIRTSQVESHPGYWRLFQVWQEIRAIEAGVIPSGIAPLENLDNLYEIWCALTLRDALVEWAGRQPTRSFGVNDEGWFAKLTPGEPLFISEYRDRSVCLRYEPSYSHGDREAEVCKLVPGHPWRPDFVLELRAGGALVELHVLDAKHRIARHRTSGVPWEALDEVWLKYTDSIGHPASRIPMVESTWILFPGPVGRIFPRSPAMRDAAWPEGRPRGGAVALYPRQEPGRDHLQGLLALLLKGWS